MERPWDKENRVRLEHGDQGHKALGWQAWFDPTSYLTLGKLLFLARCLHTLSYLFLKSDC